MEKPHVNYCKVPIVSHWCALWREQTQPALLILLLLLLLLLLFGRSLRETHRAGLGGLSEASSRCVVPPTWKVAKFVLLHSMYCSCSSHGYYCHLSALVQCIHSIWTWGPFSQGPDQAKSKASHRPHSDPAWRSLQSNL